MYQGESIQNIQNLGASSRYIVLCAPQGWNLATPWIFFLECIKICKYNTIVYNIIVSATDYLYTYLYYMYLPTDRCQVRSSKNDCILDII